MYAADLKHDSPALQQKLQALYNLSPQKKIALGFRPEYLELLHALGDPHKKLPPTIHIAGTNGKGSTLAMLRAILETAGYKVHAYISPHLIEFNERIYLGGKNISNEALEKLIDRALVLNAGRETTFFEITTAMAFAAFAENPADILLLETGLGGRLDCTNVIEDPIAAIITTISYDHMQFLGETLEQIAAEKAGIMKPGAPCIIGAQEHPESLNTLQKVAAEKNIQVISYETAPIPEQPNLTGAHQIRNARAVIAALHAIQDQFPITEQQIYQGLQNIRWPARLQKMQSAKIPHDWELWYDGGHNESGARALAVQLQQWQAENPLPLHIIVGLKSDKKADAFIKYLAPYATSITLINIPDVQSVQTLPVPHHVAPSLESALKIMKTAPSGRLLLCGSLYFAEPLAKALA